MKGSIEDLPHGASEVVKNDERIRRDGRLLQDSRPP